jgi:hypothetical protein
MDVFRGGLRIGIQDPPETPLAVDAQGGYPSLKTKHSWKPQL